MGRANVRRGGQVVDGGCHQRVAEDDAVGGEHDQAGQLGGLQGRHLEMLDGERTGHGHHLVAAGGRGDQQRAAGGAGQLFKPLAEHVLGPAAGGYRLEQGLGAGTLGIGQGAGQLDQRQWVAAGEGGQLRGYGRVHGRRRACQLGGGARLQAVQFDHGQAARVKGSGCGAHGDEHGHALGVQPAGQERHHLGGGTVKPLGVVDHDQQRLAVGRDRHQVECRDADGQRLGVHRRADRERSGQRRSLDVAKGTDVLLERPQQLGQRCERELALRLEPAGREHGHAVARSHGILEQGALADARFAGDHDDRTLPSQSRVERGLDASALRCPPQKHRPILQLPGFRRFRRPPGASVARSTHPSRPRAPARTGVTTVPGTSLSPAR